MAPLLVAVLRLHVGAQLVQSIRDTREESARRDEVAACTEVNGTAGGHGVVSISKVDLGGLGDRRSGQLNKSN